VQESVMTRFERWALAVSLSLFLASVVVYGLSSPDLAVSALQ
jgi:hypothetical protein